MSINCGAGLWKRAASFFLPDQRSILLQLRIEAPDRVAKSNKQREKFVCKLICENNNKDCENLSYHL